MKKIILTLFIFLIPVGGASLWYFNKYDTPDYEHRGFFPLPKLKPIWERKIKTQQDIKIGIITDTHVHAKRIVRENKADDAPRYLSEKNIKPLNEFNEQMKIFQPDLIFHLGDIVEGTNDKDFVSIMGIQLVKKELSRVGSPVYLVVGNHDLRSVTKTQFRETLNLESENQIIDQGDYRFIIMDTNFFPDESTSEPGHSSIGGHIPDHIFTWLEPYLQTDKQVFVFTHQPALGRGEGIDRVVGNGEHLIELLEKYNVKAIFSGHIEFNYFREKNDVKYYSFTGTKKSLEYPGSFYELIIEDGEMDVKMFYTDLENGGKIEIDFENEFE
ncbi:MAG: metallophosphoesterase [Candidatus Moranbacteria bacterium]|nr:metallophosphoesterase [Candidatus Moranbacteria bacterium]